MSREVRLVAIGKDDCQELQRRLIAIEDDCYRRPEKDDCQRGPWRDEFRGSHEGCRLRMIATQQPGKGWMSECQRKQRPNSQCMTLCHSRLYPPIRDQEFGN